MKSAEMVLEKYAEGLQRRKYAYLAWGVWEGGYFIVFIC